MEKFINGNTVLLFLIVLVSVLKFGLIGKGFLTFPDEMRYLQSGLVLENIADGNFDEALRNVFATQGRPGDAIVKIIPTGFQYITASLFGYQLYESDNAFPLFLFNYLIYILLLLVHFKVSYHFLKDRFLSLFSVLIFATLVASYISLRHADPYDGSLLILYYVLYLILKNSEQNRLTNRKLFGYGFLAFFGYLCYPGYILLFAALPMLLFFENFSRENFVPNFKKVFFFGLGSFVCLTLFEITSWTVGTSFIKASAALSTSITQGSFEECFSFLFKYLYEAEGISGVFLILGWLLFVGILVYENFNKKEILLSRPTLLFLILLSLFVAYAAFGYYFHKVVFYARLIKQFIPFVILFSVFAIQQANHYLNLNLRNFYVTILSISILLCVNFYFNLREYQSIYYPKDVAWSFFNRYHFKEAEEVFEFKKSYSYMPVFTTQKVKKQLFPKKLLFVNVSGFYPFRNLNDYKPYQNPKGYKLLFSEKTCQNFKAYQYEGYDIIGRKNLDKVGLRIKVYVED